MVYLGLFLLSDTLGLYTTGRTSRQYNPFMGKQIFDNPKELVNKAVTFNRDRSPGNHPITTWILNHGEVRQDTSSNAAAFFHYLRMVFLKPTIYLF